MDEEENTTEFTSTKREMHWTYLLCGGFLIGILAALAHPLLWGLSRIIFRVFGAIWTPSRFLQRCWGYW